MIHSFVEWLQKVWFNLELKDGEGGGMGGWGGDGRMGGDGRESAVALAIIWYTEYRR